MIFFFQNIRELQLQEISNDVETNHTNMHYVKSENHNYSCANDIHLVLMFIESVLVKFW